MGTRSLTCVVLDGKFKIAQYGQFDGYPEGQGTIVIDTMRKIIASNNLDRFKKKVGALKEITNDEYKQLWIDAGADPANDYVSMEVGNEFDRKNPQLDRRLAAGILGHVMYNDVPGVRLSIEFANDSLFCEYAYVVDLDLGVFEVYKGFQKQNHSSGRFSDKKCETSGYFPVRLTKSYRLDSLPSTDEFVKDNN